MIMLADRNFGAAALPGQLAATEAHLLVRAKPTASRQRHRRHRRDLTGAIGRRVPDTLLPGRRLRISPRIVKRAISKYQAKGPNINWRSYKATLEINILTARP